MSALSETSRDDPTIPQFLDHLTNDVLPEILDKLSADRA
jgi:hypothetical protein